jgi:hypothetical protein
MVPRLTFTINRMPRFQDLRHVHIADSVPSSGADESYAPARSIREIYGCALSFHARSAWSCIIAVSEPYFPDHAESPRKCRRGPAHGHAEDEVPIVRVDQCPMCGRSWEIPTISCVCRSWFFARDTRDTSCA